MKIWKKIGCGLVIFSLLLTVGMLNTDTTFAMGKGYEVDKENNTATYTVNNMGYDAATPFYTIASCPGKLIYQYYSPTNKVIKKGVHKCTFKIKNAPVVDLRHCGVNVK